MLHVLCPKCQKRCFVEVYTAGDGQQAGVRRCPSFPRLKSKYPIGCPPVRVSPEELRALQEAAHAAS